jgi:glucose dehydrogenase
LLAHPPANAVSFSSTGSGSMSIGKGGGGAVWDGFAYDPDANLVYVGTGNAEPWVQKFRGAQNVDNLYTCSILAVDLTTGQLKWYFQTVPNDNWDFDSVQQLMLLDLTIDGRPLAGPFPPFRPLRPKPPMKATYCLPSFS